MCIIPGYRRLYSMGRTRRRDFEVLVGVVVGVFSVS